MSREWTERHIRELIKKYSSSDGGGTCADAIELFPLITECSSVSSVSKTGIYLLEHVNAVSKPPLYTKRAIMVFNKPFQFGDKYRMTDVFSGERYILMYIPRIIESTYYLEIRGRTMDVYDIGDKLNDIPVDSIESRSQWWDANKGEKLGVFDCSEKLCYMGGRGDTINTFTSPRNYGIMVTSEVELKGATLVAEITCEYEAGANNTWPRPASPF